MRGRSEVESDGTHPAQPAEQKVGRMLLDFMLASPFAVPWFRACVPGDTNGDGRVDGQDIGGFVRAVITPSSATAQQRCGADATLLFNLAVLHEDQHRPLDAIASYRAALAATAAKSDPENASTSPPKPMDGIP